MYVLKLLNGKRKLIKYAAISLAATVIGLSLLGFFPDRALAQDEPIDLQLSDVVEDNWASDDIKPCHEGSKTVSLHNTGPSDGTLYLWVSDIANEEGLNPESEEGDTSEPGELINHMLFTVTADGLETNITFPTTIDNFPQSFEDENYIRLSLPAGATVLLTWYWELPCATGNEAQGDEMGFVINYTLEEIPSPPPPPSPPSTPSTPSSANATTATSTTSWGGM